MPKVIADSHGSILLPMANSRLMNAMEKLAIFDHLSSVASVVKVKAAEG